MTDQQKERILGRILQLDFDPNAPIREGESREQAEDAVHAAWMRLIA